MSFRIISAKSLIKSCASLTRTAPSVKQIYTIHHQTHLRPAFQNLCYIQNRGIFWGDKKQGQEHSTAGHKTEHKDEKTAETHTHHTHENVNEAKHKENAAEKHEKTEKDHKAHHEEAHKKQTHSHGQKHEHEQEHAHAKTTHEAKPKHETKTHEKFESLLENPTPENQKKLLALWTKLESEVLEKNKLIQELKKTNNNLEAGANNQKAKVDELRSRLKEEIEERELMRKRFDKELDQAKSYAITKFAKDLIEVPDNLGRALDAAKGLEGKEDNLYEGVKATNNILLKTLAKHGINQISPLGEKFDPNFHEALFDFEDPKQRAGTCGYIANVGYTIGDRVLRPAKVGVIKGVYETQETKEEK